jgi:hypothetical protein
MVTVFPQLLTAKTVGCYLTSTKLTMNAIILLVALQLIHGPLDTVWQ